MSVVTRFVEVKASNNWEVIRSVSFEGKRFDLQKNNGKFWGFNYFILAVQSDGRLIEQYSSDSFEKLSAFFETHYENKATEINQQLLDDRRDAKAKDDAEQKLREREMKAKEAEQKLATDQLALKKTESEAKVKRDNEAAALAKTEAELKQKLMQAEADRKAAETEEAARRSRVVWEEQQKTQAAEAKRIEEEHNRLAEAKRKAADAQANAQKEADAQAAEKKAWSVFERQKEALTQLAEVMTTFNLLLIGGMGVGKSSYLNYIANLIDAPPDQTTWQYANYVEVGGDAQAGATTVRLKCVRKPFEQRRMRCCLFDFPGIQGLNMLETMRKQFAALRSIADPRIRVHGFIMVISAIEEDQTNAIELWKLLDEHTKTERAVVVITKLDLVPALERDKVLHKLESDFKLRQRYEVQNIRVDGTDVKSYMITRDAAAAQRALNPITQLVQKLDAADDDVDSAALLEIERAVAAKGSPHTSHESAAAPSKSNG